MVTNYARGRACEYKAIDLLERAGYTAFRSAGSHGAGLVDVVGFDENKIRFVQVKRIKSGNSYSLPSAERAVITRLRMPPKSTFELWVWKDRMGWISKEVLR